MWWLGIKLMSLLTSDLQSILLLSHLLSWLHGQDVITNSLPIWSRVWGLFLSGSGRCRLNRVWIPSTLTSSRPQSWMHCLRSLMVLLLQSHQGSYAEWVPFLILLSCSLLLAWTLISYGASLDHHICLYQCQARCQHFNWFSIFAVIQ